MTEHCNVCGKDKPLSAFYSYFLLNKEHYCKACWRKRMREYARQPKNRERQYERLKKWKAKKEAEKCLQP